MGWVWQEVSASSVGDRRERGRAIPCEASCTSETEKLIRIKREYNLGGCSLSLCHSLEAKAWSPVALSSPPTDPSCALECRGQLGGQPGLLQVPCPPGPAGGQQWPQPVVHLHLLLGSACPEHLSSSESDTLAHISGDFLPGPVVCHRC